MLTKCFLERHQDRLGTGPFPSYAPGANSQEQVRHQRTRLELGNLCPTSKEEPVIETRAAVDGSVTEPNSS